MDEETCQYCSQTIESDLVYINDLAAHRTCAVGAGDIDPTAEEEEKQQLMQEYELLTHAMQTGVAYEIGLPSDASSPKHLRVGVNSAMVNDAAMTRLLVEKGIITELEYLRAIRDEMKREVKRYEELLAKHYGTTVSLA